MNVHSVAVLFLAVALVASAPCAAQFVSRWPPGAKEAAIAGCRESIVRQTEQDFLKRNNLEQLPPGVREQLVQTIEPFLAVCNCAMDRIAQRWSFEYFSSHQAQMLAELNQLTVGECAPANKAAPAKTP